MARLFEGFSPSPFFNGYEADMPSPLGHWQRATLLQPVSPAQTTEISPTSLAVATWHQATHGSGS